MESAKANQGDGLTMTPPLPDIFDHISRLLNMHCKNDAHYCLAEIKQAKSAQQEVYILRFAPEESKQGSPKTKTIIHTHDKSPIHSTEMQSQDNQWAEGLQNGHNRLVLRIWRGGSQWWNLYQNSSPESLAQQEIMGYNVARQAFMRQSQSKEHQIHIPHVLYVSWDCSNDGDGASSASSSSFVPWAILEYVGPESLFLEVSQVDDFYLDGMIKSRMEFGFEEPHPRWGRVPADQALQYACMVLHQVMLPLHQQTRLLESASLTAGNDEIISVYTYASMVQVYKEATNQLLAVTKSYKGDVRMTQFVQHVTEALHFLESNCKSIMGDDKQHLSPVLVHMDMQPQNLILRKSSTDHLVSSVLDWEDTAWADPRFDLLLLCRKVCADHGQAHAVWAEYAQAMGEDNCILGPIEPWLQLESVHSIITLLLQSMDLLSGGRNPWETNNDLKWKLERECLRWKGYI
jgi:hypothetical protein